MTNTVMESLLEVKSDKYNNTFTRILSMIFITHTICNKEKTEDTQFHKYNNRKYYVNQ